MMDTQKLNRAKDWTILFVTPIFLFYLSHSMLVDVFDNVDFQKQILNVIFMYMVTAIVVLPIGKVSFGLRIVTSVIWFISILNAYIFEFRNSYIIPWDIYSVGTALNVADEFSFIPNKRMIVVTLLFVVLFIAEGFCKLDLASTIRKIVYRVLLAAVVLFGSVIFTLLLHTRSAVVEFDIYNIQYDVAGLIAKNGLYVGFLYELKYLKIEKPDGYSKSDARKKFEDIKVDSVSSNIMPDIVVVMDEAFSDPQVNGVLDTNEDYMPFLHSLQDNAENTQTGYLNMSVIGGNTPNSEFEFLTGSSMAFLPPSSVAFQQFIHKDTDSLASYLGSLGYKTLAMHPFYSSGWNRTTVYPLLGFDEMYFLDGYFENMQMEHVRKHISDDAFMKQIVKEVDKRASDGPVFSFNVTIQNHASYGNIEETLPWKVSVNGISEINKQSIRINNYINLIKLTDNALKNMIEHYKNSDRPTIVVFYGDHQPERKVFDILWNQNGKKASSLTEEEIFDTYKVPFVIWANYDIEELSGLDISANYLGNLVLKAAGIPLTKYRTFTDDYSKKYPVISAIRTKDAEGNSYSTDDYLDNLNEYACMQYYEMVDDKDDYE